MNQIILTIGRQFGSGGREIGKQLASKLEISYYDKELLGEAARLSGLCKDYLEERDEFSTNSLLYSFIMGTRTLTGQPSLEELAWKAQRDAVESTAKQGSCVIVGRCADVILKDSPHLLRVFLSAPEEQRIAHVSQRDNLTSQEAAAKIRRMERSRAAYYQAFTGQKWGQADNYDICLNVSPFGVEQTVQLILEIAKSV